MDFLMVSEDADNGNNDSLGNVRLDTGCWSTWLHVKH